jgi:hypothetical protein
MLAEGGRLAALEQELCRFNIGNGQLCSEINPPVNRNCNCIAVADVSI